MKQKLQKRKNRRKLDIISFKPLYQFPSCKYRYTLSDMARVRSQLAISTHYLVSSPSNCRPIDSPVSDSNQIIDFDMLMTRHSVWCNHLGQCDHTQ